MTQGRIPTPAPELLPELWMTVFESLVCGRQKKEEHPLLPVIRVCRKWKRLASPLMYQHLHLRRPDSVVRVLQRFLEAKLDIRHIGHGARTLTIAEPTYSHYDAYLVVLFSQFRNLQSLTSPNISHLELDVLSSHCAASLSVLDIGLYGRDEPFYLPFAIIGRFRNLRRLSITFNQMSWRQVEEMAQLAPWDLPLLESLAFRPGEMYHPFLPYLDFLSRCQFPQLRHLRIDRMGYGEAPAYQKFLDHHGNGSQISKLDLHKGPIFPTMLPFLRELPCLGLLDDEPWDLDTISSLPPSVRHLYLEAPLNSDSPAIPGFAALFDTIISGRCPFRLETVRVTDPEFRWREVRQEEPFGTGWVLRAHQLNNLGIQLLDSSGEDLFNVRTN